MSVINYLSLFKVADLTPEQTARFPYYVDKWVRIGISPGKTDKVRAEKALVETCRVAGLEPPKKILWARSPYEGSLLDSKREKGKGDAYNKAWKLISRFALSTVGINVHQPVTIRVRRGICDLIEEKVFHGRRGGFYRVSDRIGNKSDMMPLALSELNGIGKRKKDGGTGVNVNEGADCTRYIQICAYYDFFMSECGLDELKVVKPFMELLGEIDRCWLYMDTAILVEKTVLHNRDEEGLLHGDGQAALKYPDGWSVYAHHGLLIPEKWGNTFSERWDPKWLMETDNAEHKRLLIETCGYARVMKELDSELIHKDGDMELRCIEGIDDETVMLLKVVCPSTKAFYSLRVPPTMEKCEQARQWTFGDEPVELLKET